MFTDGTNLYVYNNSQSWQKYLINGTDLTDQGAVTFGSMNNEGNAIFDGTHVYINRGSGDINKYDINATLIPTNEFINSSGYYGNRDKNFGLTIQSSCCLNIITGYDILTSGNDTNNSFNVILSPISKP